MFDDERFQLTDQLPGGAYVDPCRKVVLDQT